jgi:hypothetical protein
MHYVLFYFFYSSSWLFHFSLYCYLIIFIFYNVDADYFLWLYSSYADYCMALKSTFLYSFYSSNIVGNMYSNYLDNAIFYPDIFDTFFLGNKLFYKNSLYISINGLVQNSFFFDFFEFKLLFRFVFCLYSLVVVYVLYLSNIVFLKRKGNILVM